MEHDDTNDPKTIAQKRVFAIQYFHFFANRFRQIEDSLIDCSREYLEKAEDFEQIGRFVARAYGKAWEVIRTEEVNAKNKQFYDDFMKIL